LTFLADSLGKLAIRILSKAQTENRRLLPTLVAQLLADELYRRGFRNFGSKNIALRFLVGCDSRCDVRNEFHFAYLLAWAQYHNGGHGLHPYLVGKADDSAYLYTVGSIWRAKPWFKY